MGTICDPDQLIPAWDSVCNPPNRSILILKVLEHLKFTFLATLCDNDCIIRLT